MGSMFRPECECGHPFEVVLEGCGERPVEFIPGICGGCGTVHSAVRARWTGNAWVPESERDRCAVSGAVMEIVDPAECQWDADGRSVERFECPRCGERALWVVWDGIFD
jgi:hypothetical protein